MQQGQQQYQMPQMNYSMQHHQQQRQKIEKPIKGWFSFFQIYPNITFVLIENRSKSN